MTQQLTDIQRDYISNLRSAGLTIGQIKARFQNFFNRSVSNRTIVYWANEFERELAKERSREYHHKQKILAA